MLLQDLHHSQFFSRAGRHRVEFSAPVFLFLVGSMCCARASLRARSISLRRVLKRKYLYTLSRCESTTMHGGEKTKTGNVKKNNIQPLVVDFFKNKEANNVLQSHLLTAAHSWLVNYYRVTHVLENRDI